MGKPRDELQEAADADRRQYELSEGAAPTAAERLRLIAQDIEFPKDPSDEDLRDKIADALNVIADEWDSVDDEDEP